MSTIALDYLVIGHVTRDLVEGGFRPGGTATYSPRTGRALGCRVGVVTSASVDLDLSEALDGILVTCVPAAATTTFENIYIDGIASRKQRVYEFAETLFPEMVPADWKPSIVHLGPIGPECSPDLVDAFGDSFVGLTPQGWMRQWDEAGYVRHCAWQQPERPLARADAVVISETDLTEPGLVGKYASLTRVLVVTTGATGCIVYTDGQSYRFPAISTDEVDPTGAGDIFATAFFIHLHKSGDISASARFANCVAAFSVNRVGLASIPSRREIDHCKRAVTA